LLCIADVYLAISHGLINLAMVIFLVPTKPAVFESHEAMTSGLGFEFIQKGKVMTSIPSDKQLCTFSWGDVHDIYTMLCFG
jgi:hypothetical protein